jgi:hypothetical protein
MAKHKEFGRPNKDPVVYFVYYVIPELIMLFGITWILESGSFWVLFFSWNKRCETTARVFPGLECYFLNDCNI